MQSHHASKLIISLDKIGSNSLNLPAAVSNRFCAWYPYSVVGSLKSLLAESETEMDVCQLEEYEFLDQQSVECLGQDFHVLPVDINVNVLLVALTIIVVCIKHCSRSRNNNSLTIV